MVGSNSKVVSHLDMSDRHAIFEEYSLHDIRARLAIAREEGILQRMTRCSQYLANPKLGASLFAYASTARPLAGMALRILKGDTSSESMSHEKIGALEAVRGRGAFVRRTGKASRALPSRLNQRVSRWSRATQVFRRPAGAPGAFGSVLRRPAAAVQLVPVPVHRPF